jgi:hypothetical protein
MNFRISFQRCSLHYSYSEKTATWCVRQTVVKKPLNAKQIHTQQYNYRCVDVNNNVHCSTVDARIVARFWLFHRDGNTVCRRTSLLALKFDICSVCTRANFYSVLTLYSLLRCKRNYSFVSAGSSLSTFHFVYGVSAFSNVAIGTSRLRSLHSCRNSAYRNIFGFNQLN